MRKRHPVVESAINHLEHRGLDRVRAHGCGGFERVVGLSVLATQWVRMKVFRMAFIDCSGRLGCHANRLVLKVPVTGNGRLEEGWNKQFKRRG